MAAADTPLLIGISARIYYPEGPVLDLGGVWTKTLHFLEQSVAHWVMHGGAMAVMIPAVDSDSVVTRADLNLKHYAAALDGLVHWCRARAWPGCIRASNAVSSTAFTTRASSNWRQASRSKHAARRTA